MATDNEVQRLAAMANSLRPEWPVKSLVTFISRDHASRPYRDLAVALAWIATDAWTKTPARLSEAGPWWTATSMTEGQGPTQSRMRCAEHDKNHAGHCPDCIALAIERPAYVVVPPRTRPVVWAKPADEPTDLTRVRDLIDAEVES